MFDRRRMREARERPARGFGDCRVKSRETAQVELVDDQRLRRYALMSRLARRRFSRDRLRRVAAGVLTELEHRGVELERPVETPGVRIGQQFGVIETKTPFRIV